MGTALKGDWHYDSGRGIAIDPHTGARMDPATRSTLEKRNGFFILHLKGDPYQRGEAHGKLLKNEILDSNIAHYYGSFLFDLYRNSGFGKKIPRLALRPIGEFLESWYYSPLEKKCLEETRAELCGIADATGLDRKEVLRPTLAPDIMEHLAAGFLKGGKEALGNYYLGGCSGGYVRKTALKRNAPALFARNMDFPGALVWIHPTLIFSHPTEKIEVVVESPDGVFRKTSKEKQPYMDVSTAGFPGHGLTGMNASGIAMAAFVCLSKDYSRKTLPLLDFNHYLFTRAESIEGIIHLLETENLRSASAHAVVFADKNKAISLETAASRSMVREMSRGFDILVQTNHFLNPLMKKKEMEFPLERESTIGRFRLIKDAMEAGYGELDRQKMIDIISCNLDRVTLKTALLGGFPAQPITLTSVLFEPETGNFWAAAGKPPAVCYHEYRGFNFFAEIKGKGRSALLPSYKRSHIPVFAEMEFIPITDSMQKSLKYLSLSQEILKRGKVEKAIRTLEKAIELYPEPGYYYIKGILLLKNNRPEESLITIRSLEEHFDFPPVKKSLLPLWEGRCLDILGRREEASAAYKGGLRNSVLVPHVRKALKRSLRRPFSLARMPDIIDYCYLGPMEFY